MLAWIGWSAVLASAAYNEKLVLILELMCCAEVLRMIKGELKGNVKMGLVLHATRLIVYHQVLPFDGTLRHHPPGLVRDGARALPVLRRSKRLYVGYAELRPAGHLPVGRRGGDDGALGAAAGR